MTDPVLMSPPDVGELEQSFVLRAMRSGWIAPVGPDLTAFEEEAAARAGRRLGVGLSSGTAALHLGLLALGVGAGDVVVTSTLTFAATANAIVYTGARPWFVDSEPVGGTIDPELLDDALHAAAAAGTRVAAVLPVDLLGRCVDHRRVAEVAARHGVPVLSDAAESFGASSAGDAAGSLGVAAAVSFNGNKVMTTSGGGMLLTDDDEVAARVRYLATQARQPVPHYEHTEVGYNYRLSNILAALGRAQLQRLDAMIARRRGIRQRYRELAAGLPGVGVLGGDDDAADNCWLTALVVDPEVTGWTAEQLGAHLRAGGVESRPMWKPMHRQPVFADADTTLSGVADDLFATALTMPSGSVLTDAQIDRVCAEVTAFAAAPQVVR